MKLKRNRKLHEEITNDNEVREGEEPRHSNCEDSYNIAPDRDAARAVATFKLYSAYAGKEIG